MLLNTLCFLIGVMGVQQLAELPGITSLLLAMLVVAALWLTGRHRWPTRYGYYFRAGFFVVAGVLWATFRAQHYLDHRLPESLAGKNIRVTGVIEDIPVAHDEVQRFFLRVEDIDLGEGLQHKPQRLRLSWYYGAKVNAGERWVFMLRLKPPHGFLNPGGFDYEAWLYQQGVHATGYVYKSEINRKLDETDWFSLDAIRQGLSIYIQNVLVGQNHAGLITALAVGDRSPIEKTHWDTLINTGTNHLMAISGLHIGLAAAFGYWLSRRLLPTGLMKSIAAQRVAIAAGLMVAFIYALLAGLSIPTQRALIMLACFATALLLKRHFRPLDALATALFAIILWQPNSVLAAGFWFSFLAVAVIYYVFSGRVGDRGVWKKWGWMQFSIALALFPVSLMLFQQSSLISPLANFFLVPYVSFLIVPLVLLALLILPLSDWLSSQLLQWAASLFDLVWPVLAAMSDMQFAYWTQAGGPVEVVLAMAGVMLLLAPRGIPARWAGLVLILPIISQVPEKLGKGAFTLDLLDVGQGLAAVVRTAEHTLVFDTGARFSTQLDSGDAVVVPYLRQMSIKQLDTIVISHGDADHIGGVDSVLSAFPGAQLVGQDIETVETPGKSACRAGNKWHWDRVNFEFLHPVEQVYRKRNNRSCVLKISGPGGRLLLTGDIEQTIEQQLLHKYATELRAEVLVVPHHGSKTSSSRAFIKAVSPEIVLFPAGYRNRYRLPSREIVSRYEDAAATLLISGLSGAIRIMFKPGAEVSVVSEYRKSHGKYWNHRADR